MDDLNSQHAKVIINTAQLQISSKPAEIPQLTLSISGKRIPFLVDTGATMSCLRKKDLKCPVSNDVVRSIGISGVTQTESMSIPLTTCVDEHQFQHSFIVSNTTPMSLLGRDILSKLNAVISCSPDGLEIHIPADRVYQLLSHNIGAAYTATSTLTNVDLIYRLFTMDEIKKLAACQQAAAAKILNMKPVDPPFSNKMTNQNEMDENTQCFYMSPNGLVLLWKTTTKEIRFFICAVRTDFTDVDPLVTSCIEHLEKVPDNKDQNNSYVIWSYNVEPTHFFIKPLQHSMKPKIVDEEIREIQLKTPSILASVPTELWALHANHVGLLNIPPYRAKINPNKYPVYVKQYPLSKEKEDGIKPVIESLLQQGVIVKRRSQNNTPINPILKQGTNKYRFTQDLRKVNEAVYPIAPVVPDMNSILAARPADSKFYTVVDLCSACFSILVHRDTQDYMLILQLDMHQQLICIWLN